MTKSKIAMNHYDEYLMSTDTRLEDVYKTHSVAKENAYWYCVELMHAKDGRDLRILSANTFQFTVGFEFPDPDTGVLCFAYITRDYDRFYEV